MFGDVPTLADPRHGNAYAWDAQLGLWTAKAIKEELNTRQINEVTVFNLAATRPDVLAVSTWLNAGVPAAQVAEWAGHGVDVLLRVYAKCIAGQQGEAKRRIEAAMRAPAGEEHKTGPN